VRPSLETWRMFRWLKPGGTFVLQVCTDFTGTRPTGSVHNNTVRDYLLLFEPLGTVISLTDWAGTSLKPGEAGHKGVIVVTRNEVT